MSEYPTPEHNQQEMRLAKALEAFNALTRCLDEIEDSGEYVDLNKESGTVTLQRGDIAVTKMVLPVDELREKKAALEELISNTDSSMTNLKELAQKQLWKADLYLIAHDKEEEKRKKNTVVIESDKPLTDPILLKKLEETDFSNLDPVDTLTTIEDHRQS